MDSINNSLDDLKKIVGVLQQSINSIKVQGSQIQKNIDNLKVNIQQFMQLYQQGKQQMKDAIR